MTRRRADTEASGSGAVVFPYRALGKVGKIRNEMQGARQVNRYIIFLS
jgi:hypothetical protein